MVSISRLVGTEGGVEETEAFQSVQKASSNPSTAGADVTATTTSRLRATDDHPQLREPRTAVRPSTTAPLA